MTKLRKQISNAVLHNLRRGPGEVNWVPPALGFGNHLYMWLHAWSRQQAGTPSRILYHKSMAPWLQTFPQLAPLTVRKNDVGLTDRRFILWGQAFGEEFKADDLEAFIKECLLSSHRLQESVNHARAGLDAETLVINVRRGDYYNVPTFFERYGMNIEGYLILAAEEVAENHPFTRIRLISDDTKWCRLNLKFLDNFAPIDYGPASNGPLLDLATLAGAHSLVLANSTFSYWGAYMNNVMYDGGYDRIWAPIFHARHLNAGRAWQLDPRWNVIEQIPGGWDPRTASE